MELVDSLQRRNAELKTELRLLREQAQRANDALLYIVTHLAQQRQHQPTITSTHADDAEGEVDLLSSYEDLSTSLGDVHIQGASAGGKPAEHKQPACFGPKILPSPPSTPEKNEDFVKNFSEDLSPALRGFAARRFSRDEPSFSWRDHQRLRGLAPYIEDKDEEGQMAEFQKLSLSMRQLHSAFALKTYYEENVRPVYLRTLSTGPSAFEQAAVGLPAGELEVARRNTEVQVLEDSEHSNNRGGADLFYLSGDTGTEHLRTVVISNIASTASLAEVLEKVRGGTILNATYMTTSVMKVTPPMTQVNAVMVVFASAASAAKFVHHCRNREPLRFWHATRCCNIVARVEVLSTPTYPPPHGLISDVGAGKASRLVYLKDGGRWDPHEIVTEVIGFSRHARNGIGSTAAWPLRFGRHEDGLVVLEYARVLDAVLVFNILARNYGFFENVERGFSPDPCARPPGGKVEETDDVVDSTLRKLEAKEVRAAMKFADDEDSV